MLGFLYRILIGRFRGCKHGWLIIAKGPWVGESDTYGTYYTLQCKHCGDITSRKG